MSAILVRRFVRLLIVCFGISVIVMATLQTAQTILAEAGLSFLGLGTGLAYPSWGQMIALGRDYVNVAWWISTFPGLAILFVVLAINLVGDRARDVLDPRGSKAAHRRCRHVCLYASHIA